MSSYKETLDYLFGKLPMYQRKGEVAYKVDIGNIVSACEQLDNPHQKFRSIHIAGTNGKGSTAHMLASILQEAGYKTGLYTSPHLKNFRERIKINGKMIEKNMVVDFVKEKNYVIEKLDMSFFEMTVAMAFDYFAKEDIDIAIVETGLGGRLDSTNIISPELSIITNISYDHRNLLGNSIKEIAKEKAGIIKKSVPVIIGRNQNEIKQTFIDKAKENDTNIQFAKDKECYSTDLKGLYQKENIATTITAIKKLNNLGWKISEKNIHKGLAKVITNTGIMGRWQTLSKNPLIICDIGHNEDGIKQICKQIENEDYKHLHFVFGVVNDKSIDNILELLPNNATFYFCKADIPRAMDAQLLMEKAKNFQLFGKVYNCVSDALINAKRYAKKEDFIFIGGSTFVVAEIL